MMEEEPIRLTEHCIEDEDIDPEALRVVERLHDFGFYAYLVGGSVRDLLLDRTPKDFDVVTSAQPNEIRRLFRKCRLIGRRFRLAHITGSRGQIIETATFRAKPKAAGEAELIIDDNQFGTPHSDALRRDFRVNALFYDPIQKEVIDYINGLEDLEARVLRTIGDPNTRFREDPVRMLRAVKFAARLSFSIADDSRSAIIKERAELSKAAIPRLYQEVVNLLNGGAAAASFELLDELRLLEILMPEIAAAFGRTLDGGRERIIELLHAVDQRKRENQPVTHAMLLAALFWPVVEMVIDDLPAEAEAKTYRAVAAELTRPFAIRLSVPRKTMEGVLVIIESQLRYDRLSRKRSARGALARQPSYGAVIHFAQLRNEAGDLHSEEQAVWENQALEHPPPDLSRLKLKEKRRTSRHKNSGDGQRRHRRRHTRRT
ncbi:MAG: polynucleotide adenylyltransferase PcnB [Myxococcota bacterium]|nr:polynucleotide adenylyltransferase PcnB [Myxococcota bacterium]